MNNANSLSKAKEDQAKNENLISYNRTTYKEITKTYDFMQFLDEIAGYSVGDSNDSHAANNANKSGGSESSSGLDSIPLMGEATLISTNGGMEEEKEGNDEGSDNEDEIPSR